ncbi:hypothetical protein C1H76_1358 [Elsinoe australis]|uniref:Uncharacterized protein n=1 Tax=Elsinoe australis TaxID=40998 RepID=A0A4U7BBZ0_9PEZI|nr:hypothetical protein C1H76_1358 [Elsinoe australis]
MGVKRKSTVLDPGPQYSESSGHHDDNPEDAPASNKGSTKFRAKKIKTTGKQETSDAPPDVPVHAPRPTMPAVHNKAGSRVSKSNKDGDKAPDRLKDGKPNATVQGHAPLASLDNAKAVLKTLPKVYKRSVDPSGAPTTADQGVEAFLLGAPLPGRTFRSQVKAIKTGISKKNPFWSFTAIDSQRNVRYFGTIPEGQLSQRDANELGRGLVEILNHWSGPISAVATEDYEAPATNTKWREELMFRAARVRTSAATVQVPVRGKAPTLAKNGPKNWRVDVTLYTLDPDSALPVQSFISLTQSNVSVDAVPDVPDGSLVLTYDNGKTFVGKQEKDDKGKAIFKSNIGADKIKADAMAKFHAMERLGRIILLELQGKVLSITNAKKRAQRFIELHGGKRKVASLGVLDGAIPWVIETNYPGRETLLYPSAAALKSGCTVKKGFSLPTVDKSWFVPIISVLEDTLKETQNIDKAFAEAALICQAVLEGMQNFEKPPSICGCNPIAAQFEEHPCTECMRGVVCSALKRGKLGLRVCGDCLSAAATKTTRAQTTGFVFQFLSERLGSDLRSEAKVAGRDTKSDVYLKNKADCIEAIKEELSRQVSGETWTSALTSLVHTLSTTGALEYGVQHPADPSLDAIMPYSSFQDTWIIHTRDNIWIVEQALNMAKHVQIVPFMVLIGNHLRLMDQNPSAEKVQDIEAKVVKASKRYRIIRIKAGYTQKARLGKPFKKSKLTSDREEWVTGKLRMYDAGPWSQFLGTDRSLYSLQGQNRLNADMVKPWSDEEIEKLAEIARRYQKKYGVVLEYKNECPYFGSPASLPETWDWVVAYRVCTDRFTRLRDWCNIKGCTIETPKTIYVFCIIIACVIKCEVKEEDPDFAEKKLMKDTFAEFLSLPLVLEAVDGLRFMIGHNVHNKDLRTGVHPETLEFDLAACNALMETCTSNYLKHDYPEHTYDDLKHQIRSIQLTGKNNPVFDDTKPINPRVDPSEIVELDVEDIEIFQPGVGVSAQEDEDDE